MQYLLLTMLCIFTSLNIDPNLLKRHPFPGPGLAIRILGDISQEKVKILQEVDAIFIKGLKDNNLYEKVWQAGAILLNVKSVGVMGDCRTYESVCAIRCVSTSDFMTADWYHDIIQEVIIDVKKLGIRNAFYLDLRGPSNEACFYHPGIIGNK